MKPTIKFVRLTETAIIPSKKHATDSGYDICSDETISIPMHSCAKISTGIAAVIPNGYEIQVRPRSGLAARGVIGAFGTVDEGYQGEIGVILYNHTNAVVEIRKGDRISQLVPSKVDECDAEEISIEDFCELKDTERGTNGFGSTGVA